MNAIEQAAQSAPTHKGDRVLVEGRGYGTVLDGPSGMMLPIVFDDDIAPVRYVPWWIATKVGEGPTGIPQE